MGMQRIEPLSHLRLRNAKRPEIMDQNIQIENLTTAEKLALMERLWDDLSRRPDDIPSPGWHGDILKQRMDAVHEGRTSFVDFDAAKKRLQDRLE